MVSEKELDAAFSKNLLENSEFRGWVLKRIGLARDSLELILLRDNHPWSKFPVILPNSETGALEAHIKEGETDVLAIFEDQNGQRTGVHFENKLASGSFTPFQPDMYAARAESWVGDSKFGAYHQWITVLLAPELFIDKNAREARKLSFRITHEDIGEYVDVFAQ